MAAVVGFVEGPESVLEGVEDDWPDAEELAEPLPSDGGGSDDWPSPLLGDVVVDFVELSGSRLVEETGTSGFERTAGGLGSVAAGASAAEGMVLVVGTLRGAGEVGSVLGEVGVFPTVGEVPVLGTDAVVGSVAGAVGAGAVGAASVGGIGAEAVGVVVSEGVVGPGFMGEVGDGDVTTGTTGAIGVTTGAVGVTTGAVGVGVTGPTVWSAAEVVGVGDIGFVTVTTGTAVGAGVMSVGVAGDVGAVGTTATTVKARVVCVLTSLTMPRRTRASAPRSMPLGK